jgi:hypothetical protein
LFLVAVVKSEVLVKAKKTLMKGAATSTLHPKRKPAVPICISSSDDENAEVVVVKKPPTQADLALIKDVEFVSIVKEKEKYLYLVHKLFMCEI